MKFLPLLLDVIINPDTDVANIVNYYLESFRDGIVACFGAAWDAFGNFSAWLFSLFN